MTSNVKLKEAFEIESKHTAFYTGGNIEWKGNILYCQNQSQITLLNINDGTILKSVGEELSEDADFIQTFTTDGSKIITSNKSGLLKLWNENGEVEKIWKYIHKGPIASLNLSDNKLASGGADGKVRIWDLDHQACILNLTGCQGVVNVVKFHPTKNFILATGDDGKIIKFELEKGNAVNIFDAHFSKVTSIVFCHNDNYFVSCGRDKVLILWHIDKKEPLKTIPLTESIESIVDLPAKFKVPGFKSDPECFYVACGGEKGVIRIWDMVNAKEVYVQTNSFVSPASDGGLSIIRILYSLEEKSLAVVTSEQNILIHHMKSFVCMKQFIGFSDEILDIAYMGQDSTHMAVATNSPDIKLYEISTMNCSLLKGHTDIVLSLNVSKTNPNLLLSSSKDNTIRLWLLTHVVNCVGVGRRHNGSVGSCFFSQTSSTWAVSVSQDNTLKKWEIPSKIEGTLNLNCTNTELAHQKDINCVAVSPNDQLIATSSQDKTCKLYSSENLGLIGILRGHKRGVWCVRFSPFDQVAITSSADCSIKLWSVKDLSCLKTFESHESSVLRVEFISRGMQILSAGADGLIKVFSIKSSECDLTLTEHDGKVWALAVKNGEKEIVSGGSDSVLIRWKDVSEEKKNQKIQEDEERVMEEQRLSNYLQNGKLLKALKLALRLDRPYQVLKIVQEIIKVKELGLADTIKELRDDQKDSLLKCATTWNMNSKNCHPAQLVINILLNELQAGDFRPSGLQGVIEGTLPYTERHFKRLTQLMQDINIINFTINCIKPNANAFG